MGRAFRGPSGLLSWHGARRASRWQAQAAGWRRPSIDSALSPPPHAPLLPPSDWPDGGAIMRIFQRRVRARAAEAAASATAGAAPQPAKRR